MTKPNEHNASQQPIPNSSKSIRIHCILVWIGVIVLFCGAGTAFWWAPLVWPQLSVQRSLEHKLASLERPVQIQPQVTSQDLNEVVARLKGEIESIRLQIKSPLSPMVSSTASPIQIPILLAYLDLKLKVQLGHPYIKELEKLRGLVNVDLSPLEEYAAIGVPTLLHLSQTFKSVAYDISTMIKAQKAHTFWEKAETVFTALVKIEKIEGMTDLKSDEIDFRRLNLAIKSGDFEFVFSQIDQISLPENEVLKIWRIHAESYVTAQRALENIAQTLVNESK